MREKLERAEAAQRRSATDEAALRTTLENEREEAARQAVHTRGAEAEVAALKRRLVGMEEVQARYGEAAAALEEERANAEAARTELKAASLATERLEKEMGLHAREAADSTQAVYVARAERDAAQALSLIHI